MTKNLTYKDAGVDIDAGNKLVDRIKPLVKSTHRPEVMGGLGGFGGCFAFPSERYQSPVLVSATDGVGTKLKLAIDYQQHDTIGIDLVAMSVNDLVVIGAEPLFFLDYYATSKLSVEVAESVIKGIADGCKSAGCALLGGETAEMPGLYQPNDYDLAGFCVGVVEQSAMVDGQNIATGDALIGIASSGPHSNGYSLIRHIIAETKTSLDAPIGDGTLLEALMAPTTIYVKSLLALHAERAYQGAAHITGGGFQENIPRMLPTGFGASIDLNSWKLPAVFSWLQTAGHIDTEELLRTFNCGCGMVLSVKPEQVTQALTLIEQSGLTAWTIGTVTDKAGVEFSGQLS